MFLRLICSDFMDGPENLAKLLRKLALERRISMTGRADQSFIKEFITITNHDLLKIKIAKHLQTLGKCVYVEKYFNFDGIRCKPDIAYFESGLWNIVEIQTNREHKNNILRNKKRLSKIAKIKVIYV